MVFVKVRETYDLHTLKNKMSVIGIHTPRPGIIKRNFPGLLMQCKAYRPVSCDVKIACASMLPLDPQGVGLTEGDVAPEDVFNPILYKAVSNFSMSQIEAFINKANSSDWSVKGDCIDGTPNGLLTDDFNLYYGFLSDVHGWKHASPQAGLEMRDLRPLVYEKVYNIGQTGALADTYAGVPTTNPAFPLPDNTSSNLNIEEFYGKAKPMPWLPCTDWQFQASTGNLVTTAPGFPASQADSPPYNAQVDVPAPKVFCGCILVPPSRLHQLFYRLVCEWTLEFSTIRSLSEITTFNGVASIGAATHFQDYSFESKILDDTTDMVDVTADSGIKKVM